MAIPQKSLKKCKSMYPYPWMESKLHYLGITLTYPLSKLQSTNFDTICRTIQKKIFLPMFFKAVISVL